MRRDRKGEKSCKTTHSEEKARDYFRWRSLHSSLFIVATADIKRIVQVSAVLGHASSTSLFSKCLPAITSQSIHSGKGQTFLMALSFSKRATTQKCICSAVNKQSLTLSRSVWWRLYKGFSRHQMATFTVKLFLLSFSAFEKERKEGKKIHVCKDIYKIRPWQVL